MENELIKLTQQEINLVAYFKGHYLNTQTAHRSCYDELDVIYAKEYAMPLSEKPYSNLNGIYRFVHIVWFGIFSKLPNFDMFLTSYELETLPKNPNSAINRNDLLMNRICAMQSQLRCLPIYGIIKWMPPTNYPGMPVVKHFTVS